VKVVAFMTMSQVGSSAGVAHGAATDRPEPAM
jgi:hypothetical protein